MQDHNSGTYMYERAERICSRFFKAEPSSNARFTSGICGYVFHVTYPGEDYVIKMYREDDIRYLESTLYWLNRFEGLNLRLPRIVTHGIDGSIPYVMLTYLPGDDLGNVYRELSVTEKKHIAKKVIGCQNELKKLGKGRGFGYLSSFDDNRAKHHWKEVIVEHIHRSKTRIAANGFFDPTYADKVSGLLSRFEERLDAVPPLPFFDDATTKNVLVFHGEFSGLIDFDNLCFGDDLYAIALTRMSLINSMSDQSYVEYLKAYRGMNDEEKLLDFYTLIFCIDFMGEKGMAFNGDEVSIPTHADTTRLETLFEKLYNSLL